MANGVTLEIYSENGGVQVLGDGGISFGLSAANSITLNADPINHPQPMVVGKVVVTGTNPVLAWKATGNICLERITNSGSTFTFNLRAQSSQPIGLQYWVFDTTARSTKDPSMADIEAAFYDEYGVATFDATMSAMRVVDAIVTPKDSDTIEVGRFPSIGGSTNITVPTGKVYAVVQSTAGFVMTTYDTGSYSNSQQQPQEIDLGDGQGPPPGFRWRYQHLESYQSTGGYSSANVIKCGMTRFESWPVGWQPASSTPHKDVFGQARHMIVDVTGFTAAAIPNPTVVSGSVNASSRSVTTGGAAVIAQSSTAAVTCSASGGTAPYAFAWEWVSGDTTVVANGSATSAAFSTQTLSQPQATTRQAVWRCRITDQNGIVGYAPEVTFTHIASSYSIDVAPDPVSFTPITINSNDPDVAWIGTVQTISGITQAITLRIERYSYSGNLDGAMVDVVVRDANGNVQFSNFFDALGSGQAYLDVTVQPGWSVGYYAHAVTNSGRKSASWQMVVWNLSNPGGSVQISSQPVSAVVDADDNFNNADHTPNALNWANCTFTTNDNIGAGSNAALTISGINRTINLRFTLTAVSTNFSGGDFYIYKNGVRSRGANGYGLGYWTDVDVVNGDQIFFLYDGVTLSGRKTLTGTITVTNTNTGATVDTFTITGTLDDNDDWNNAPTPDYTPSPISVPNLTLNTNAESGYTQDGVFQVTGINQPIVLRFTRGNQVDSGGIFTRRLFIYHSTNGGASYVEYFIGAGAAGTKDITVNNGDYIILRGYFDTTGGRGFSSYTGYIANLTTGVQLASYSVSGTVDANDDYDRVRITFDGCTLDTPAPSGNTTYSQRTISGLLRPHVLRFTRDNINTMFMEGNIIYSRQIIGHNVGGNSAWTWHTLTAAVGAAVEFTVNNGDLIYVHGYIETSMGAARSAWSTYMSDQTTGEYIGSWYTNGLVDSDNNFNVVALSVHVANPYSSVNQFMGSGQFYGASDTPDASVSGGLAPYTYRWTNIGGLPISVSSLTALNPSFSFNAYTSWSVYSEYQLEVTDARGNKVYAGFTADWRAGDQA